MLVRKLLLVGSVLLLSACSSVKPVIDVKKDQRDQKSYAVAYDATVQTYQGRVNKDYDVNSFVNGTNDWYIGRILLPIDKIKENLFQGAHDSDVYTYYSGVVFASDLEANFSRLSPNCWASINKPSLTQGIYDAMRDIQKNKTRKNDDPYLIEGSNQLLQICNAQ